MQLTERHIFQNSKALREVTFKSARLYNFINYHKRQAYFGHQKDFKKYEVSGLCAEFDQFDYRNLPAQTSQQTIGQVFDAWKSFWASIKDWGENPSKYSGKPHPPKYKDKEGCGLCVFTNQQIKLKNGFIHFIKNVIPPIKTKAKNICQVRIVPQATCFVVEIIYEIKIEKNEDIKKENFLSLDLGLNNFATSINNVGEKPFIINGKVLKSVNQAYNKGLAVLKSFVGVGSSNRIKKFTHYRNNFIEDKIHKISRFIIDYCLLHNIGKIIIGHNKNWKSEINIGNKNNQNFVNIPHSKFIDKVKYKAEIYGIEVVVTEESYTSKVDHLALEEMKHQEIYLGKRKFRGLFQSSTKKILNADINGAIGIARKVFGDSVVKLIADSGLAFNPIKLNIL